MDRYLLQSSTGKQILPKTIHLIRHGQSTHNAHLLQPTGADLNDIGYLDAPLTTLGVQQATSLQRTIPSLRPELIVTSPLTRATQTCLHAITNVDNVPIVINPLCRERLAYACDIGSPTTTLRRRFPMLDYGILEEIWWWTPPSEENTSAQRSLEMLRMYPPGEFKRRFTKGVEPVREVEKRVNEFRLWLLRRPERSIVVFAHGVFNSWLLGGERMGNCEVRKLVL